jgi:hypothetical protein
MVAASTGTHEGSRGTPGQAPLQRAALGVVGDQLQL